MSSGAKLGVWIRGTRWVVWQRAVLDERMEGQGVPPSGGAPDATSLAPCLDAG